MIPRTFPSSVDGNGRRRMRVFPVNSPVAANRFRTDPNGYIPVKYNAAPSNLNSYGTNDAIMVEVLSSVSGLQPWVDYIPVADDGALFRGQRTLMAIFRLIQP